VLSRVFKAAWHNPNLAAVLLEAVAIPSHLSETQLVCKTPIAWAKLIRKSRAWDTHRMRWEISGADIEFVPIITVMFD
jgi:hypothetical protein